ncbi:zinc-binding alcohol dehydrogenase family protein [soil metagenome]|jgi:2-desacetyl-2-hydroxyethyl bacteriochlorophyllide A dehydrogenase
MYSAADMPQARPGYAIIRTRRIGICGTDIHAFDGTQPFFKYPRILGHELSGELIDTGGADGFVTGQTVTFIPYDNCGHCIACRSGRPNCCVNLQVFGVHVDGGMAAYLQVPAGLLVGSAGLGVDELALVEPLAIGAHGVRRANVQRGEFVLVVGAGPIGLGIMEFARIAGGKVIAIDMNEQRLAFCREKLNVAYALNAISDDIALQLAEITSGEMPTVVFDATGNQKAINNSFYYMAHAGRYVLVGLQKGDLTFSHPEFHKREGTLMSSRNATREDFEHVINCIKNGLVHTQSYITHKINFADAKAAFENGLITQSGVIKSMLCMD